MLVLLEMGNLSCDCWFYVLGDTVVMNGCHASAIVVSITVRARSIA